MRWRRVRAGWRWVLLPVSLVVAGTWLEARPAGRADDAHRLTDWAAVDDAKLKRTYNAYRTPEEDAAFQDDARQPVGRSGLPVHITMSPAQLRYFRSADKTWPRTGEEASIAFGDGPARTAVLTVHGWSTEDTERKSFSVRLFKRQSLTEDCEVRKFLLVNMLFDKGSFRMQTCYRLLGELGLFPSYNECVSVFVNDHPEGLYLLVERPEDGIRRSRPDVVGVLRRRWMEYPELKYAAPDADPVRSYRRIVNLDWHLHGEELAAAYERHLDLDQYMLWLAFNSLVRNSDYLDEAFFYEERGLDGRPGRMRVAAWDYDDLFKPPGHKRAFSDSLLYACEARIDARIQAEPVLYARYAAILHGLLAERLTAEHLVATLATVRAELDAIDTGEPPQVQEAQRETRAVAMAEFERQILARRLELLHRLETPTL